MSVPRVELAPGYSVPRVIHGAWQLSAGHREARVDTRDAVAGLVRLAEAGFDTFDCADIYTGVEELLGEVIAGASVPVRVHTKLVPDRGALPGLDRAYVERVVDRSLRRLGVERLDLVQLHWWDLSVPGWVEAAGWLDELRRAGKVAHVGATNFDAASLRTILDSPISAGVPAGVPVGVPVTSDQVQISLLDRRAAGALAELARERGVALLGYGSLAGGLLTERWLGAPDPTADGTPVTALPNRSLTKYKLIQQEWGSWELFQELLRALRRVADRHDTTIATVALRWTLDQPETTAVVLGASGDERLGPTLDVFRVELDDEDREAIESVLARARGPEGEVYGLERNVEGRHGRIMRYDLNRF